ncbi:MAG: PD-(D/E)XK nuclease family protein, partial [Firmicutes bacterium]|nr:PD-(D/E)XK nuclease family protein [Bacillota bacterium]
MLTIYRGRESIDKETFLYDRIRERGVPAIVLVPDQYTLAAERQALARLDSDVLLGIEILGFSRLGSRVLAESGDGGMHFIDRYGRHMLLARLLRGMEDDLSVFSGSVRKESFVKAVNDFISRAKQYEIGPADLLAMDENGAADPGANLLTRKLADLSRIFAAYEDALTGKFTDSEDLIDLWRDRIAQSRFLAENEIWLYGFDSFTPKNLSVIKALLTRAPQVHVLLTYDSGCRDEDLFRLSGIVTGLLADLAREAGCDCHIRDLKPQDTGVKPVRRAAGIRHLERTLYAVGSVPTADEVPASHEGIDIVRCANIYNEAESAASFVLRLLREEGLRFRDIVVICNDQEERTPIISRIFDEYGLDVFADRKRPLLSSPIAVFITGLIETAAYGYRSADVFRVLKTGLGPLADEEIEELENYVQKYRIKGKAWKQPFPKGGEEYGPEGLARIESLRQKAIALFTGFDAIYRAKGTNGDFVRRYYEFLSGAETGLADHIARLAQDQEAGGFADLAAETRQIWAFIMSAFGQIDTLIGDEPFRGRDLLLMLESGLSQMEVGVLPPTVDDILLGTMQRTRFGDVQALLVLGANEGVLPMEGSEETLFSPEELASLSEGDFGLGAAESIREMEEQLAIYRDFSRPARHLYLSYSVANEKAEELRPSELVTRLQDIFPGLAPANDVLNRADPAAMLGGSLNTLRHFTEMLKQAEKGQLLDPAWQVVRDWLAAENPDSLARVRAGLAFENRQEPLPPELAAALYHRDYLPAGSYTMSPSQLERYGRCPFYHFVRFGLRPDELRSYEVSGREIGDLYHEVLMEFCKQLNEQGAWESITREESDDLVRALVAKAALSYREGLFELSADER